MNDRAEKIRLLFAEYEKAFSSLDFSRNADFYADNFISAGPLGSKVVQNDEAFRSGLEKGAEFYRSIGMNSGEIVSLTRTDISDQYSLVKVHWGAKFAKTGDRQIEFDVSYLVQDPGDEPKIILFISHEDEQKVLRDLGLLPQ